MSEQLKVMKAINLRVALFLLLLERRLWKDVSVGLRRSIRVSSSRHFLTSMHKCFIYFSLMVIAFKMPTVMKET